MNKFIKFDIKPQVKELNDNIGSFVVGPLELGFGNTIGNALRRTLLSNIPGASIFAIKIENIDHEFQAIDGIKEDVTQIILNLKKLVLKINEDVISENTTIENWPTMSISVSDAKTITANDIQLPVGFDIVNKDLYIATKTTKTKAFKMEIYARTGRGFKTFKDNKELVNVLGIIATDSDFSPVINVSYNVDEKKIAKNTIGDVLTLDIATNGSITPTDAIAYASTILMNHFAELAGINEKIKQIEFMQEQQKVQKEQSLSIAIDELELSVRSNNCLKKQGIKTIKELLDMPESKVKKIKNLGNKSFREIVSKLQERGLQLKQDESDDEQDDDNGEE